MIHGSRARLLALFSACALTACSSVGRTTYSEYGRLLKQMWSQQFGKGGVTRDQAAAIEYASMGWRVNGEREQIIVLATDTGGEMLWTSSSHVVLVTRDGRVRRTVGLPHDVGTMTGDQPSPAKALQAPFGSTRQEDFPELGIYGLVVNCRATARTRQTVTILGAAIPATRVDESCSAVGREWAFTDQFWVNSDGLVVQALQHIHPSGDVLQTQIFRPPS